MMAQYRYVKWSMNGNEIECVSNCVDNCHFFFGFWQMNDDFIM